MGEAAPVEQAHGQGLHIPEDGGAGGGEAGDRFEEGVDEVGNVAAEYKGKGAKRGNQDPGDGHDHKAILGVEIAALGTPFRYELGNGRQEHQRHGGQKAEDGGLLPLKKGDAQGWQHEQGHDAQDVAVDGHDHSMVHFGMKAPFLEPFRQRCRLGRRWCGFPWKLQLPYRPARGYPNPWG